jgi:S-type Pyocin
MGKFVGGILGAALVGASFAFGGPFGAAASKLAVGLFLGGASSILGFLTNTLFGPKAPKPQQSQSQIKSPTPPRVYCYGRRRVYGATAFWGSSTNGASVDVIAFLDGQSHAMVQAYLNDEKVTIGGGYAQSPDGKAYADNIVQAGFTLGLPTETAHAAVIAALPSVWTTAHRGDGVTTGYMIKQPVKEKRFIERYPQGDNVVLSAVFDGQLCYDPRSGVTGWTDNPVLHLLHYYTVRLGYDYVTRILPKIALWNAAANICDQIISGEKRYRAWVLYDSTAKPHEVIASIAETFDGWTGENEAGEVLIYAGQYTAPTVTINASHIVEYEHQSFVNDEDYFNEISVKYISAEHDYNEVEAQPWRDESDITERGYVNSTGIDPQVPSYKQARHLAKVVQARNNARDRGTVTTNYGGRIVEGQRFINLQIVEAGVTIFSGVAEIIAITRNLETSGYTFQWVKADPNAWTWNPATEDGYGAPTGTFPTIAPPSPPAITGITYAFDSGAQTAALAIQGTGPARGDLTWYARTRRTGDTAWLEREYPDIDGTAAVELTVDVAPIDTEIEVQISYITGSGAFSGWSATETITADSSATAPDNAGAIALIAWTSSIALTTSPIARARSYRWRFYEDDGTTLLRTITTTNPTVSYWNGEAAADGIQRAYVVTVAGVNIAGEGTVATTGVISNAAPAVPANLVLTGGAFNAEIAFDAVSDATGYAIHYHNVTGFNPATEGKVIYTGGNSQIIYGLAADTYYFRIASYDGWTRNPALINFTAEGSLTITTGGGAFGTDGGGGYIGDGVGGGGGGINMP